MTNMLNNQEEWRAVKGYEGLYEVSNLGKIRNAKTLHILSIFKNKRGYCRVDLWKNNKQKKYAVHRVVAEAFIPNIYNKPQVNHIDENKSNNNADNLEWCTQLENHNCGTVNERISKSLTNNPKKSKPVAAYDDDMNLIASFPSIYEASRQVGISASTIGDCLHHRRGAIHAGGYRWQFQ